MSDGGTVNPAQKKDAKPKKKAWYTTKFEEKDAHIAELEAKLAALEAGAEPGVTIAPPTPPPGEVVLDPLGWVTADMDSIGLVSTASTIVLNGRDEAVSPAIPALQIDALGQGPWTACPFEIGDKNDQVIDQNLKIFKANWWRHLLTRRTAETYYRNQPFMRRETAVINPEWFRYWDVRTRSPVGKESPIGEFVPLRELLREILQRVSETFMDYTVRRDGQDWDPRFPNPYNNKIMDVPTQFRTMPQAVLEAQKPLVIDAERPA